MLPPMILVDADDRPPLADDPLSMAELPGRSLLYDDVMVDCGCPDVDMPLCCCAPTPTDDDEPDDSICVASRENMVEPEMICAVIVVVAVVVVVSVLECFACGADGDTCSLCARHATSCV